MAQDPEFYDAHMRDLEMTRNVRRIVNDLASYFEDMHERDSALIDPEFEAVLNRAHTKSGNVIYPLAFQR